MLKYKDYEQYGRNAIFYATEDYLKNNGIALYDFEMDLGEPTTFYNRLKHRVKVGEKISDLHLGVLENYLVVNGIAEDVKWF